MVGALQVTYPINNNLRTTVTSNLRDIYPQDDPGTSLSEGWHRPEANSRYSCPFEVVYDPGNPKRVMAQKDVDYVAGGAQDSDDRTLVIAGAVMVVVPAAIWGLPIWSGGAAAEGYSAGAASSARRCSAYSATLRWSLRRRTVDSARPKRSATPRPTYEKSLRYFSAALPR